MWSLLLFPVDVSISREHGHADNNFLVVQSSCHKYLLTSANNKSILSGCFDTVKAVISQDFVKEVHVVQNHDPMSWHVLSSCVQTFR